MNVIWAEHERIHKGVCGVQVFYKGSVLQVANGAQASGLAARNICQTLCKKKRARLNQSSVPPSPAGDMILMNLESTISDVGVRQS